MVYCHHKSVFTIIMLIKKLSNTYVTKKRYLVWREREREREIEREE